MTDIDHIILIVRVKGLGDAFEHLQESRLVRKTHTRWIQDVFQDTWTMVIDTETAPLDLVMEIVQYTICIEFIKESGVDVNVSLLTR